MSYTYNEFLKHAKLFQEEQVRKHLYLFFKTSDENFRQAVGSELSRDLVDLKVIELALEDKKLEAIREVVISVESRLL